MNRVSLFKKTTIMHCCFIALFFFTALSFNTNAVVVLQYHHIADDTPASTSTSPDLFAQHLEYLAEHNFNVLSLKQVIHHLKNNQPFAEKSVLITFDDGYMSILDTALPLLKQKGFAFTVFVNSQPIEQKLKQFMDWQQLATLAENKGAIVNHTVSHPYLVKRLNDESEQQWQKRVKTEITQVQNQIEKHLAQVNPAHQVKALAYPYGEYNAAIESMVSELGYIAFGQHSGAIALDMPITHLPRFPMGASYGEIDKFIQKINSKALPIARVSLLNDDNQQLVDHVLNQKTGLTPKLYLQLKPDSKNLNVNCYLSGQGAIKRTAYQQGWLFQAEQPLGQGRSRFNCTAIAPNSKQVYWFSQPWLVN
jgi:poly-beta-1,6-N-acetyl-D-glucosamine N-deacetylase